MNSLFNIRQFVIQLHANGKKGSIEQMEKLNF